MFGVSKSLSLTVFGSSTKASLGGVCGFVVEVTQSGVAPTALVAVQPAGKAGAATPSKFSLKATPAHAVAVATGVAVAVVVAVAVAVATGTVAVEVAVATGDAVEVGVGVPLMQPSSLNI